MQSLKIDIIYNVIPTDFEMEFNLGGCCRMRLLTSMTHDRKEYVDALSRAVQRSKIIIACGPIYGDSGLIYTSAKAIGKPLTIINNKDYSIADDQNVRIIDGSIPLVTPSGLFGGVIIESGPQTLIILSDNKTVRKSIMENLIHPYIQEMSIAEMRGSANTETVEEEPIPEPEVEFPNENITEEIKEDTQEAEDLSEEIIMPTVIEPEEDAAPSDEELKKVAEEINVLTESINSKATAEEPKEEPQAENPVKEETPFITQIDFTIDEVQDDFEEDEHEKRELEENFVKSQLSGFDGSEQKAEHPLFMFESEEPMPKKTAKTDKKTKKSSNKALNISIIITAVLLAIILAALCYFIFYVPYTKGISTMDFLKQIFDTSGAAVKFVR